MLQKRVVNVYRLITRGTLEEKIMGLQKFKMNIANTVISQENTSLQSMGTDQLLDLFTLDKVRYRFVRQLWALYNLCMKLGKIIHQDGLPYHQYGNYTQIHILDPDQQSDTPRSSLNAWRLCGSEWGVRPSPPRGGGGGKEKDYIDLGLFPLVLAALTHLRWLCNLGVVSAQLLLMCQLPHFFCLFGWLTKWLLVL